MRVPLPPTCTAAAEAERHGHQVHDVTQPPSAALPPPLRHTRASMRRPRAHVRGEGCEATLCQYVARARRPGRPVPRTRARTAMSDPRCEWGTAPPVEIGALPSRFGTQLNLFPSWSLLGWVCSVSSSLRRHLVGFRSRPDTPTQVHCRRSYSCTIRVSRSPPAPTASVRDHNTGRPWRHADGARRQPLTRPHPFVAHTGLRREPTLSSGAAPSDNHLTRADRDNWASPATQTESEATENERERANEPCRAFHRSDRVSQGHRYSPTA